jgi:hypothetical protein
VDIIDPEDLNVFASLGVAIWAEPELSERNVLDTISAAALFGLTPEKTLEKACRGLLEKAKGQSVLSNWSQNPLFYNRIFYRLSPEERFVITAVHLGHWSYDRLVQILDKSEEEIQELLWQARLVLNEGAPYPAGPTSLGRDCPEYHSRMPWTQRFLDRGETLGRYRFFLIQHMLACQFCAGAMARCRAFYFRVDQEVLKTVKAPEWGRSLNRILEESPLYRYSSEISVRESLVIFLRNSDVRLILCILIGLILFLIIRLAAFTTSV